jgi:hypothetical protein
VFLLLNQLLSSKKEKAMHVNWEISADPHLNGFCSKRLIDRVFDDVIVE